MGKNSPDHMDMNKKWLHIGDLVRYEEEAYGIVTSKNDIYVFVRFFGWENSQACYPDSLEKG